MIAIGIGCRKGASKTAIVAVIAAALAHIDKERPGAKIFSAENKSEEAGLISAARELTLPLAFLSFDALRAVSNQVLTLSKASEKAFGVPSVAEAAALAGCGPGAQLLVPRITGDGVTCAIAKGPER